MAPVLVGEVNVLFTVSVTLLSPPLVLATAVIGDEEEVVMGRTAFGGNIVLVAAVVVPTPAPLVEELKKATGISIADVRLNALAEFDCSWLMGEEKEVLGVKLLWLSEILGVGTRPIPAPPIPAPPMETPTTEEDGEMAGPVLIGRTDPSFSGDDVVPKKRQLDKLLWQGCSTSGRESPMCVVVEVVVDRRWCSRKDGEGC